MKTIEKVICKASCQNLGIVDAKAWFNNPKYVLPISCRFVVAVWHDYSGGEGKWDKLEAKMTVGIFPTDELAKEFFDLYLDKFFVKVGPIIYETTK